MFSEHQEVELKVKNEIHVCKFVNVWKIKQDIYEQPMFQSVSHKGSKIILWGLCKWKYF